MEEAAFALNECGLQGEDWDGAQESISGEGGEGEEGEEDVHGSGPCTVLEP